MEDKKDVCDVRVIGTVAKKFDLKKSQGGVSWIGFSISFLLSSATNVFPS